MKHPQEERDRWLRQAAHDLDVARKHFADQFFADVCYAAEQAAQKALKGYLYGRGERSVPEHALLELVQRAGKYDAQYRVLSSGASTLTQYYIPTRYPDALPGPSAPFEVYTKEQAAEAIRIAEGIVGRVQGKGE